MGTTSSGLTEGGRRPLTPGDDGPEGPATRRVLVVDDHRTVAELLRLALDAAPGLGCVGVAYDCRTAVRLVEELEPDVVLCDLHLGAERMSGVEVARAVQATGTGATILITGDSTGMRLTTLHECGASGLLVKDGDLQVLLATVRDARRDQLVVDPSLLRMLSRPPMAEVSLSPREGDVLRLMGQGKDVVRIARELGITTATCRGYVKALLHKLDAHTQLEAVVKAQSLGLLERAS
ncbi:response regulator transcription factor [Nocardioides sp. J2M5]|uniref:response regulator transcription factor n=1 Tax=Nocardioides palaemonis TaxID=2829810 RepID=UPI001BACEC38|nr:response regulator transcription factor [Nocardioides palaemonis]MBS2938847.1 response regulator transcription factor [Nocardioides palaemonis]